MLRTGLHGPPRPGVSRFSPDTFKDPKDFKAVAEKVAAERRRLQTSAVVGSITAFTAEIRLAGNPPRRACSRMSFSSGAR